MSRQFNSSDHVDAGAAALRFGIKRQLSVGHDGSSDLLLKLGRGRLIP